MKFLSPETEMKSPLNGIDLSVQKDNLKTMVIPVSVPKTMKFIPENSRY